MHNPVLKIGILKDLILFNCSIKIYVVGTIRAVLVNGTCINACFSLKYICLKSVCFEPKSAYLKLR